MGERLPGGGDDISGYGGSWLGPVSFLVGSVMTSEFVYRPQHSLGFNLVPTPAATSLLSKRLNFLSVRYLAFHTRMPLNIVVTGASGLIGSAVCKLAIDEGHTVLGVDRVECSLRHANFTFKLIDTTDYQHFMDVTRGCDAMIHLAAVSPVSNGQVVPQEVQRDST